MSTNTESVVRQILGEVAPDTDPQDLDRSDNFREVLDIDSMDFLNVMIAINDRLGVSVPERDYGRLTSVEALVRFIDERLEGARAD